MTAPKELRDGADACNARRWQNWCNGCLAFWESGPAVIALAALVFSLSNLAVKVVGSTLPVFEIAFVQSIGCLIATTLLVIATKTELAPRSSSYTHALTIARALLGAASLTLFYIAIQELALKDAVTIFFCSPVIAAALEWCIHGDNLNAGSIIGSASTVMGVFLLTQPDCVHHIMRFGSPHAMAMAAAGAAATANAAAFVVVRLLKDTQSATTLTWWYHLVVAVVTIVPLLVGYPSKAVWPSQRDGLLLLGITGAHFFGQLMLNRGFQLMSATRGSAINVLQVLFSFVWDLLILKDDFNWLSVVGSLLVMAGVVFVALQWQDTSSQKYQQLPLPEGPELVVNTSKDSSFSSGNDSRGGDSSGNGDALECGGGGADQRSAAQQGEERLPLLVHVGRD